MVRASRKSNCEIRNLDRLLGFETNFYNAYFSTRGAGIAFAVLDLAERTALLRQTAFDVKHAAEIVLAEVQRMDGGTGTVRGAQAATTHGLR